MVTRLPLFYEEEVPLLSSTLARNLRLLRQRAGLTQEDVAERTALSQSTWSRLEVGQWGNTLDRAEEAMVSLGLDPRDLLSTDLTAAPGAHEVVDMWSQVDDETRAIVLSILKRELRARTPKAGKDTAQTG